eukprot:GEMP01049285.1.p1 GENE.GEMP01049285.1~~GEMP01049285.1.p1  ORF type:complete len:219 (+),score=45.31 GEMP01049285.1:138-794(+)
MRIILLENASPVERFCAYVAKCQRDISSENLPHATEKMIHRLVELCLDAEKALMHRLSSDSDRDSVILEAVWCSTTTLLELCDLLDDNARIRTSYDELREGATLSWGLGLHWKRKRKGKAVDATEKAEVVDGLKRLATEQRCYPNGGCFLLFRSNVHDVVCDSFARMDALRVEQQVGTMETQEQRQLDTRRRVRSSYKSTEQILNYQIRMSNRSITTT